MKRADLPITRSVHPLVLIATGKTEAARLALDTEVAAERLARAVPMWMTEVVVEEVGRRKALFESLGAGDAATLQAIESITADVANGRMWG